MAIQERMIPAVEIEEKEETSAALRTRIALRTAPVRIVGLGCVGLPLAMAFGEAGFRVVGVDVDVAKIDQLAHGRSHVTDVADAQVSALVTGGQFAPTAAFDALSECDCIVI